MKKQFTVTVQGHKHMWSFNFYGDPAHLEEWRADGLVIDEVINTCPDWFPFPKVWFFFQDILNFKNPWA